MNDTSGRHEPVMTPDPHPIEPPDLPRKGWGKHAPGDFADDFQPMAGSHSLLNIVDNLLKHPARLSHEVTVGRSAGTRSLLLATVILCMAGYGAVMGSFSGGPQLWVVPIKAALGMLAAAVICLPSLYVFASLSGCNRSFLDIAGLLMQALALCGVLLVGFAPVAWIFSQSTSAVGFMGFLHLMLWFVSLTFGLRLLEKAFGHLNEKRTAVLRLWSLIFFAVALQMCTTLRPLVGRFEGYGLQPKKFFVEHCLGLK